MPPHRIDDMAVKLVKKRRRTQRSDDPDLDSVTPELIAKTGDLEYRGRRTHTEMNHDFFIGVADKGSNLVHLFEVSGMFSLRPFVRRAPVAADGAVSDPEEKERTLAEQRQELLETFGGNRSKKRVATFHKDRITEDNITDRAQEQVKNAAKAMKEKDASQGIHHLGKGTTESMAPPHDSSATKPKDAYPLEGLITPGELAALEQEAWSMLESYSASPTALENPGWHNLVWGVLIGIAKNKELSIPDKVHCMQAAMHLHYLIVLARGSKTINEMVREKMMEDMAVDHGVMKCLLERFTVPFKPPKGNIILRRKSQASSARVVLYGVIMWVTASGFSNCGRLDELADALGVGMKLMLTYASQAGFKLKMKREKGSKATRPQDFRLALKVPLSFPEIRRRQGRPQKRA